MDFPTQPIEVCAIPDAISEAFAIRPVKCARREDYIVFFNSEAEIAAAAPNMAKLSELDLRGVAITAPSNEYDFVVRFFAPRYGINEDPVTGSAYTQLTLLGGGVRQKSVTCKTDFETRWRGHLFR